MYLEHFYNINYLYFSILAFGIYLICLSIYRLFFAPLSRLPGSFWSKLNMLEARLNIISGNAGDRAHQNYYQYGDVYRVGPNMANICNPADCRAVLATHRFKKSEFYQMFALIDDTMFTTQSAELAHLRRKQVGPAFTHGYMTNMEPTIIENGIQSIKRKWDGLLKESREGQQIKVPYASHFTMATFDVIGALGYGQQFHALENERAQIINWVDNYNRLAVLRVLVDKITEWPATMVTGGMAKKMREFVEFGNNAAETRRQQLRDNKGAGKPRDVLQALIDGEDPDSKIKMTPTQITAENITFLIAGTDTTSLTMTWTLHYLMLYPDCYHRTVDEIRSRFSRDHTITYAEGKSQLPYLDACIYESMRIHAVSGVPLSRVVPEGGATFQGYYLPAGTYLGVNIAGANHHQETWENPRRFWPERFIGDEKLKQNVFTFSSGIRICPGRSLAYYEMITILANILKDYDFRLPEDSLFTPERLDEFGNPAVMPCTHSLTVGPKYPDRDCQILVNKAP